MQPVKSLFLTALILLNLFGFYAVFMVQQWEIKGAMSKAASDPTVADRQIFNFSNTGYAHLNWTVAGKEFIMDGHLYDVIGFRQSANQIELTVASDAGETELVGNFLSLFSQQQDKDQNSAPLKTLISHFQQDYVVNAMHPYQLSIVRVNWDCILKQVYPVSSFVADNLYPPPQLFPA